MTTRDRKNIFAKALLLKGDSFEAALAAFDGDTKLAMAHHASWEFDPEVVSERERLENEGDPMEYLPSKVEYARKVWNLVDECRTEDGKMKMLRLYGEVRGFLEKPGGSSAGGTTNITQNKVMIVNNSGDDSEWKARLKKQQEKLINGY